MGHLPEEARPDKVGVVLETMRVPKPDGSMLEVMTGIARTEADLDALDSELLGKGCKPGRMLTVIAYDEQCPMIVSGDEPDVDYWLAWLAAARKNGGCEIQYTDKKVEVSAKAID
jgi:hypothetical protein